MNFDETELKKKSDHTSNDKVTLFCENIVLIEEELFLDKNLTYCATFPTALIKSEKYRSNQKINLPLDTKRRIRKIVINNFWNTQIVHILHKKRDGIFIFKGNMLSRLTKPVELSHDWVLTNLKYQEPEFYSRFFEESEQGCFEVPPVS